MIIYCGIIIVQDEGEVSTLKDVMVFLTVVPPLGFGDVMPSIIFVDTEDKEMLPKVSTCSLILNFPIVFNIFKDKMDLAILGSQGFFGRV